MKIILFFIFLFSLCIRLLGLNQMGRTWDEELYISQGYKFIELFKKGDINNSYFYTTYDHPPLVKYLYGITSYFDLKNYDFTASRILSAIVFSLGVVLTSIIGWKIFSSIVGVISGVILSLMPFSLGLSQLVTAESFKVFIYPLAIYCYILLLQKNSWKNILLTGIVLGIAFQIKQSNILLIPLLGIVFFYQYKKLKRKNKKDFIKNKFKTIGITTFIGIAIFFIIWPQALFHFEEISAIHKSLWTVQFSPKIWQITLAPPEVFMGRLILAPVFYYPVYFLISIPVGILFLFFIGLINIMRKLNLNYFIILAWFLLSFTMSFYSWRQHGLRYIIEIYPAICLIAAIGLNSLIGKFVKNNKIKFFYFIPIIAYLFVVLWQIKPYYLDYFNELVGGTNTVYKYRLFQQGWWGQGLREAGLYLKNNARDGLTIGLAISPDHVLPRFDNLKYSKWKENKKYDYVVVNYYHIIRDRFDDSKIRKDYALVYEVKADKAVLAYIYKKK